MDKSITVEQVRVNLNVVSDYMKEIIMCGTFEKFTDNEKDYFNRMKILLDNTRLEKWTI